MASTAPRRRLAALARHTTSAPLATAAQLDGGGRPAPAHQAAPRLLSDAAVQEFVRTGFVSIQIPEEELPRAHHQTIYDAADALRDDTGAAAQPEVWGAVNTCTDNIQKAIETGRIVTVPECLEAPDWMESGVAVPTVSEATREWLDGRGFANPKNRQRCVSVFRFLLLSPPLISSLRVWQRHVLLHARAILPAEVHQAQQVQSTPTVVGGLGRPCARGRKHF